MPTLSKYHEFQGRHYETGTLRNVLAYQGVVTPHTGKPISEALLLGISGGITFGYFTFEYKGFDPQVNLLSRNTFDPFETILDRLSIPREVLQTTNAKKGKENLTAVLESGKPAIVWADSFRLSQNASEAWWAMLPLVVFGYDEQTAHLADRSSQPITIRAEDLDEARARVKKDKFRVMSLGNPDLKRLPDAVKKGMEQCIRLFTQAPPKGARDNFGFTGMEHWRAMLTNTRNKASWARYLPAGRRAYVALAGTGAVPGVYDWIMTYGASGGMERDTYADFLEEAAALLFKSKLESAAHFFRQSAELWRELAREFLPDDTKFLRTTRNFLEQRHTLFLERGGAAQDEIKSINAKLQEKRERSAEEFPWDEEEYADRRARWSDALGKIREVEEQAVRMMQTALT